MSCVPTFLAVLSVKLPEGRVCSLSRVVEGTSKGRSCGIR